MFVYIIHKLELYLFLFQIKESNENLEKAELEKKLQDKDDKIAKLQNMIVTSGHSSHTAEPKVRKTRRETWCPGKLQRQIGENRYHIICYLIDKTFFLFTNVQMYNSFSYL